MSARERWAEGDAARAEAQWGMRYTPDDRPAPESLARAAAERGDAWFQVDIPVVGYQGNIAFGSGWSRAWRAADYDHIGAIERQGWSFVQMSSCFVERGMSSNRGNESGVHGDVVGVYVFRRRAS